MEVKVNARKMLTGFISVKNNEIKRLHIYNMSTHVFINAAFLRRVDIFYIIYSTCSRITKYSQV